MGKMPHGVKYTNLLYGLLIHTFSILGIRQTEKALNVNITFLLIELHFPILNFIYKEGERD